MSTSISWAQMGPLYSDLRRTNGPSRCTIGGRKFDRLSGKGMAIPLEPFPVPGGAVFGLASAPLGESVVTVGRRELLSRSRLEGTRVGQRCLSPREIATSELHRFHHTQRPSTERQAVGRDCRRA